MRSADLAALMQFLGSQPQLIVCGHLGMEPLTDEQRRMLAMRSRWASVSGGHCAATVFACSAICSRVFGGDRGEEVVDFGGVYAQLARPEAIAGDDAVSDPAPKCALVHTCAAGPGGGSEVDPLFVILNPIVQEGAKSAIKAAYSRTKMRREAASGDIRIDPPPAVMQIEGLPPAVTAAAKAVRERSITNSTAPAAHS